MILKSLASFCKDCIIKIKGTTQQCECEQTDTSSVTSSATTSEPVNEVVETKNEPVSLTIKTSPYSCSHGKKFKKTPTWIVVHYTACANVSAKSMCKAMQNNTGASSHFYIDDTDVYSAVPLEYVAWHVGDGQCKQPSAYSKKSLEELSNYKCNDWRYDLAAQNHMKWKANNDDFTGNGVSIGVDICVWKRSTATKKATDKDWYCKDAAIDNLAKTVAHLAKKYNIRLEHIIRHGDASGKPCPRPMISLPGDISNNDKKWDEFKSKVADYMDREIAVKTVKG